MSDTNGTTVQTTPDATIQPPGPTSEITESLATATIAQDEGAQKADESMLAKMVRTKLLEVSSKANLEVQQKDPNNPLFSAKSFEELNLVDELKKGLRDMGFMKPSKIQETALPLLLKTPAENMIAQSQSGTGKTAAFSLTVLSRIDVTLDYPQALILSPTYELALQTGGVVSKMGQYLDCKGKDLIQFGTKANKQTRGTVLKSPIIIGTPGTILDWIVKFKFFDPKKIKVLVFDEADVMISTQGHKDQSTRIKRSLNLNTCQSLLFSATYDDKVLKFAKAMVKDPNIITLKREEESLTNIKQYYVVAKNEDQKLNALFNIYGIISGQAMIFCETKKTAGYVAQKMNAAGHAVALLTGGLDMDERSNVIKRFQQGLERVLISTNLTARGIDVEQVTLVVNFDLPRTQGEWDPKTRRNVGKAEADCETYLHRIGRTGRFGKSGIAINMIGNQDDMQIMKEIETHFKRTIEQIDYDDIDDLEEKLAD